MVRHLAVSIAIALAFVAGSTSARALTNPDQISVVFPAFQGGGNLGRNVSTVLSLQLAQTTRRYPWPENPSQHDFGEGMIRCCSETLSVPSHEAAAAAGQRLNVLAQIVVWGRALHYGTDVIVEPSVTIPRYLSAPSSDCGAGAPLPCDFREQNFERWSVDLDGDPLVVDVPRRGFSTSIIVLKPEVVDRFRDAAGLPIQESRDGGRVLGVTGPELRFIEFNRGLRGAPAKLRSGAVEGYVSLPELSDRGSEFADMVGGVIQIFRGDWAEAVRSFSRVIENPQTRTPLRVDALLYRGMAEFRNGGDGRASFRAASNLAPFDHVVVRYVVMGEIAADARGQVVRQIVDSSAFLFPADDPWLRQVQDWLEHN